jgi:glycosyltransferase involved in cell wall biosynthesis
MTKLNLCVSAAKPKPSSMNVVDYTKTGRSGVVFKQMKIIHVNFSGSGGGAAIAALRISNALNERGEDIESILWCARRPADRGCYCFNGKLFKKLDSVKLVFLSKLFRRGGEFSVNIFPSMLIRRLNRSDADVIHLHWINGELLSIKQLGQLKKPVVWTFHDMWPFCGGEHYAQTERYNSGYSPESSSSSKRGSGLFAHVDLDRWIFRRKLTHWKKLKLHIVCPSRWLAYCSRHSVLLGHVPTSVIPNCLDLETFYPMINKSELRQKYGLPLDKKIILFGAVDPDSSRKGGDLLLKALGQLKDPSRYVLAVFGSDTGPDFAGIRTVWLGRIFEEARLAEVYNCADVMCVPSRQDNLPNTCIEAHACGVPIVAFNIGGIPDIVDDRLSGYLAKAFEVDDFARGIEWILEEGTNRQGKFSVNSREKALLQFNGAAVSEQYIAVYQQVLKESK